MVTTPTCRRTVVEGEDREAHSIVLAVIAPDSPVELAPVADWTLPATELRRSRSVRNERVRVLHEIGPEYGTGRTVPLNALTALEGGAS